MNTFFKGKKLLVVGGTSGMGLAVARMVGEPAEFGKNRTLRFSGHP